MNKKIAWLSAIGGVITSLLGILGALCVTPVCGTLCISGILAAITGVGIVTFLHKYHAVLIVVGFCILIVGIILIFKCKKKCICTHGKN